MNLPPVRDCEGRSIWRLRVAPGELTCTGCGEIAIGATCPRCGVYEEHGEERVRLNAPPLVPTLSYLHEGEYE